MAKGINRAQLLGNVGRDPEMQSTRGGALVAKFSLATPERMKDARGEWKEVTEWHNVVTFGRTAEIVRDYVKKGSKLLLEGKLQTQSWEDKASGKKMYRTEIICFDLTLLGDPRAGGRPDASSQSDRQPAGDYGFSESFQATDEDVPF